MAVSQHTDTSCKNTKAILKMWFIRCIVMRALFSAMIGSFHNSIHPPEMVIEPSMVKCGCQRGWGRKRMSKLKTNKTKQTKQQQQQQPPNPQQQTNKQQTKDHGYTVECIWQRTILQMSGNIQSVQLGNATTVTTTTTISYRAPYHG